MKFFSLIALLGLTVSAFAVDVKLEDYQWNLTDVSERGLSKEKLFNEMDIDYIKPKSSICSNRALMWANDFKRDHNLNTAKIFVFFTSKKNSGIRFKSWWYHVAPVINENGQLWVVDPAFQGRGGINNAVSLQDWMKYFNRGETCKEIKASETEFFELMFSGRMYPESTSYGYYPCYYRLTPHTFWTPNIVAQNMLGVDSDGKPVRVERPAINKSELMQSCVEATAGKIGLALGASKAKCEEYLAR